MKYRINKRLEEELRIEKRNTMQNQLENLYSPLDAILKMNQIEFERYFEDNTSSEERIGIENEIWVPYFDQIIDLLKNQGHLLSEFPDELLKLIAHILVWKSEYERIRSTQQDKKTPVTGWIKGKAFPKGVNEYVSTKVMTLRQELGLID